VPHRRITRIIGIREFRENLSKCLEEAQKNNVHFVVLRYGDIAAHVTPPETEENIVNFAEAPLPRPKSTAERRKILRNIRDARMQFPGHDGVAYQRRQRT